MIPLFAYSFVLIFGVFGLIHCRRDTLTQAFLLLLVLNTVINGIFMTSVRYRLITDFVLIIYTAVFLQYIYSKYQNTLSNNTES